MKVFMPILVLLATGWACNGVLSAPLASPALLDGVGLGPLSNGPPTVNVPANVLNLLLLDIKVYLARNGNLLEADVKLALGDLLDNLLGNKNCTNNSDVTPLLKLLLQLKINLQILLGGQPGKTPLLSIIAQIKVNLKEMCEPSYCPGHEHLPAMHSFLSEMDKKIPLLVQVCVGNVEDLLKIIIGGLDCLLLIDLDLDIQIALLQSASSDMSQICDGIKKTADKSHSACDGKKPMPPCIMPPKPTRPPPPPPTTRKPSC